ncbi:MAG: DUF3152 domain-containing protein [Candidatus Saccharimonadales bacterium]
MRKTYKRRNRFRVTSRHWRKRALWLLGSLLVVLALANATMWFLYRGKVLPHVRLGAVPVGNVAYDELDDKVAVEELLPPEIALSTGDKQEVVEVTGLGVSVDWPATSERLRQQRSWLPLLNLVVHRTVPVELAVDNTLFSAEQARLAPAFSKPALPERIVFSGQNFEIAVPEAGYELDAAQFQSQVLAAIETGRREVTVPTKVVEPALSDASLDGTLQSLREKLGVAIKFTLSGQEVKPGRADIGGWFVPSGRSMAFSAEKAKAYAAGLGDVYNSGNAALAANYALDKLANITFVLSANRAPAKYTYCAATKGVDQAHLPGFIAKTAAVLGDPRGWNAGGKVAFERVESGCDFSLWLSAPSQMTSFGGLCDSFWSCRSGRNVVINFDRWQGATDAWNNAGGGLEDYRAMVTNHEVGHWLGFGHRNCPGAGQPAPVMQQQSINLQGCKFNPWPTEPELSTLKQARGIAMLPAREDYTFPNSCCSCGHCAA